MAPGDVASYFAPVSQGTVMSHSKPVFTRTADAQRIVHREKIAKVTTGGTGVFAVLKTIALNPGMAASFPWLANEAAGWECYRFNRLRFIWVPSVGTAQAGNIIMGPDYDAADSAPVGEAALSSYTDVQEANVWVPFACELEPDLLNGELRRHFVRNGALAANLDIKTYDCGNFFVAVSDDAAAQTGKLWVEYDVEFYNPQVPSGGFFQTATISAAGGSIAAATPYGAAPVSTGAPTISVAAATPLVTTITGCVIGQEYEVSGLLTGTVITVYSFNATSGATFVTNPGSTMVNAGGTQAAMIKTFTATAETVVLTASVTATTVTAHNVTISVLAPVPSF